MYLPILFISLSLTTTVLSDQIDVMKISNVAFPNSGTQLSHYAATARATQDKEIPEVTICYRMLIDSYNNDLFIPFASYDDGSFSFPDRMCWKCGRGSEGYQGGLLVIGRNIPGGGLGNRRFPMYHQYNLARDIAISKWTHICDSYSTETHLVHMYQDRLKVFNFTYGEEKEDPLPPTTFELMRIAANMRGLFTDLQIYNRFSKKMIW